MGIERKKGGLGGGGGREIDPQSFNDWCGRPRTFFISNSNKKNKDARLAKICICRIKGGFYLRIPVNGMQPAQQPDLWGWVGECGGGYEWRIVKGRHQTQGGWRTVSGMTGMTHAH